MATYTMTFAQLKGAIAINSFVCLNSINEWYDSLAESLKEHRLTTYESWTSCGKVNRATHQTYYELRKELQFFLDSYEYYAYSDAQISLTPQQIALLQAL